MTDGKEENTALTHAGTLHMDPIEAALLGVKTEKAKDPHENAAGSYERFMMMAGGPLGQKRG